MRITLAAMTLSASMILVDQTAVPLASPDVVKALGGNTEQSQWLMTANILPLAALMIFGGRLGDLLGLRRVFITGAIVFGVATMLVGFAQDFAWAIAARAIQGCGAALMMPTALAIVSAVYPSERRGAALGVLAGASAFFAALGPVLGGILTSIDWRLVFLINVPLAAAAVFLTLRATPLLEPAPDATRNIDLPGVATFGLAAAAVVYGLGQGPAAGWDDPTTIIPLALAIALVPTFVVIERRAANPMLKFGLFRHINFLAANVSQFLAGMIELGLGFLTPFFLLLVVGISPLAAGIALIPATLPIIIAGPLSGKAFDRYGGRPPAVIGFLLLALSGIALAIAAPERSAVALIPGLVLQGLGLGIVLTANDPTGMTAVPERDQGVAAGTINTTEQLGGAVGIAVLSAIELGTDFRNMDDRFAAQGIEPTPEQVDRFRNFLIEAEQKGLDAAQGHHVPAFIKASIGDVVAAHVDAFQVLYSVSAGIALLGAISAAFLIRKTDRIAEEGAPVLSRRSRWTYITAGSSSS
jgi:EmrB/QacA subfamily drug resistance transporter